MTSVDEKNSIYVGDLPHDCTDTQLRHVFELYGAIVSVIIVKNRALNGNCYGFVTFTNPRSTVDAIKEMDGKTIGGQVVRVNVKSRGTGRGSLKDRENFRQNQRNTGWDGGRGRGRKKVFIRDMRRGFSRELDGERQRWHDRPRDHFQRRDRDQSREMQNWEHPNSRNHDREPDKDYDLGSTIETQLDRGVENDSGCDKNKDHGAKRKHSSSNESYNRQSREHSSELGDHCHQEQRSDPLIKRQDELQKLKSDIEQSFKEKKQQIADLRKRSVKLEDALTSAKELTSTDQLQLNKLCKCFQRVKEYGEKLKSFEQEFQDLVDSVSMEIDPSAVGPREIYLKNAED